MPVEHNEWRLAALRQARRVSEIPCANGYAQSAVEEAIAGERSFLGWCRIRRGHAGRTSDVLCTTRTPRGSRQPGSNEIDVFPRAESQGR